MVQCANVSGCEFRFLKIRDVEVLLVHGKKLFRCVASKIGGSKILKLEAGPGSLT